MNLLSWNCQGLGWSEDLVIPRFKEMRKEYFPEVLFLMEKMNKRDVLVDLQEWLGYDRVFTREPIGRRGGLALFWNSGVEVDFLYADKNLLDLKLVLGSSTFFASYIYGDPGGVELKSVIWGRLSRIGININEGWCISGNFDDLIHGGKKVGDPNRNDDVYGPFNDMLRTCRMGELPSSGNSFTWGGRRNDLWIQCKLDKCFGNRQWFFFFLVFNQKIVDKRGSDHRHVLIRLISSKDSYRETLDSIGGSSTSPL